VDDPADRLFASLPAVFRQRDESGELEHLLRALGTYFLGGDVVEKEPSGLEEHIERIPALFAPLGERSDGPAAERTPDRFIGWLAAWLAFTPYALFPPERLRHIIAGIVPLYARRGTRNYLERLLQLCFDDEIAHIEVDDRPRDGFTVGESTVGNDTRLAVGRPFSFKVLIEPRGAAGGSGRNDIDSLHQRVRAVIDYAKPAHTVYELQWRQGPHERRRSHAAA
jgi:phage tail-like protein